MMKQSTRGLRDNEQGLVAIVVTLLIMIILTLIVTGFAQLARREQRQALDRQLSTQALYAAESGINDGRRLLKTTYADGSNKDTCDTTDSSLDDNDTIQYTCLLIKQDVPELKFQNVSSDPSIITPINASGVPGNLVINWQKQDSPPGDLSTATIVDSNGFPSVGTWNAGGQKIGMIRVDLVPATNFSADGLRNGVFTAFLVPGATASGSLTYTNDQSSSGQIITAGCNNSAPKKKCSATISLPGSTANYYLRIKSLYSVSDVSVCVHSCDGTVALAGSQAQIDSTGRAGDVLKRIQVRVSTAAATTYNGPEFVLDSSENICKQYEVWPAGGTASAACGAPTTDPSPVAPTGGGGGPGTGDAAFDNNCSGACADDNNGALYGSATNPQRWTTILTNRSNNVASTVSGCKWVFGDGSPDYNGKCQYLDEFSHDFPVVLTCKSYPVSLTIYFNDGKPDRVSDTITYTVPDNGTIQPNGQKEFSGPC